MQSNIDTGTQQHLLCLFWNPSLPNTILPPFIRPASTCYFFITFCRTFSMILPLKSLNRAYTFMKFFADTSLVSSRLLRAKFCTSPTVTSRSSALSSLFPTRKISLFLSPFSARSFMIA